MNVRRNAATLTNDEWAKLMGAFVKLKHTRIGGPNGVSIYDQFVAIHLGVTGLQGAQTTDGAHGRAAFLPWHREFLRRLELALQYVEPGVTLPYWNWGADISDTTSLFTDARIGPMGSGGASGFEVVSGYLAQAPNALNSLGWQIHPDLVRFGVALQRNRVLNTGTGFPTALTIQNVLSQGNYNQFRPALESPHGTVHIRVGRDMSQMTSPNDPIFWLHHAQVDRIWAKWQVDHPGAVNYNPANSGGQGHRLNDAMWPWDAGASQTTQVGIAGLLPAFARTDIVRPADVLDHHALGYCYDDEPACPCEVCVSRPTWPRWEDLPIPPITIPPRGGEDWPTTFPNFEENPPLTWEETVWPPIDPRVPGPIGPSIGPIRRTPFGDFPRR